MASIENRNQSLIGFPIKKPSYPIYHHGWFLETHIRVFHAIIQPTTQTIIELGSWYGSSTRWLVENSNAKVYAIDMWDDSFILNDNHYNSSHELRSMLRSHPLYESFLQNLWEYKDRVTPLRMKTIDGLQYLFDQGTQRLPSQSLGIPYYQPTHKFSPSASPPISIVSPPNHD